MSRTIVRRRPVAAALLTAALAALGAFAGPAAASTQKVGPPTVIDALGDSITRGFHTVALLTDSPDNSWSTGANPTVNSLCSRIKVLNAGLLCGAANGGNGGNDAVTGAKALGTNAQALAAVARTPKPDLVTVLIGANDVCTSTEAGMTPTTTFRTQINTTLQTLSLGLPDARIQVLSIPDISNLWAVGRVNASALARWSAFSVCRSMLINPNSFAAADVTRRANVRQRNIDLNTELQQACAQYIHCKFDNNAAFNLPFTISDLSPIDFFHPNVSGQAKAAAVAWSSGFDYADLSAPTTTISRDRTADGVDDWYRNNVTVTLSAADGNDPVAGTEYFYKLDGAADAPWTKYTGPVTVSAEGQTEVVARSVDSNGNIEASKSDLIKIDKTAPTFDYACTSALLNGSATATTSNAADDRSGFAEDPNGSLPVDTSSVGPKTSQTEVQDRAGNTTTHTCSYDVTYAYSGVSQPVNLDGSSVFKQGSTVPVKFQLRDAGGVLVSGATARLASVKLTNDIEGTVIESTSNGAANDGDAFRPDGSGGYIFNLGTKPLSAGTWNLRITLDDGQVYRTRISLR